MRENGQRRGMGEGESLGREAGFSATAAKCAVSGRNDGLWVGGEENRQRQRQRQRQRRNAGILRCAQNDERFQNDEHFQDGGHFRDGESFCGVGR